MPTSMARMREKRGPIGARWTSPRHELTAKTMGSWVENYNAPGAAQINPSGKCVALPHIGIPFSQDDRLRAQRPDASVVRGEVAAHRLVKIGAKPRHPILGKNAIGPDQVADMISFDLLNGFVG